MSGSPAESTDAAAQQVRRRPRVRAPDPPDGGAVCPERVAPAGTGS